jgi:DNA-binding response OmpR family regulator
MSIDTTPARIAVVEDNAADLFLLQKALQQAEVNYVLDHLPDGEAALQFFFRQGPYRDAPRADLLVLDLHLPKYDGLEVLRRLRECELLQHVAVVILSTSDHEHDRTAVAALHVDHYVVKSPDLATFMQVGQLIKEVLATQQKEKKADA